MTLVVEYQYWVKTSPKGFSASKCVIENFIFSKSQEFFEKQYGNFLENFFEFFGFFFGIFWNFLEFFGEFLCNIFGGIFLVEFFGGIFLENFFWEEFFGRNSLFTLALTCLSRFCLNGEGQEIQILRSATQAHRTYKLE